jgi:Tn3 transposase DDE domain
MFSEKYIALFSHFIPCGVREATYILDGLMENRCDIQPELIHSDSNGQSEPVFGLAYLLGIKLTPRIKNWKHLAFYRPHKNTRYQHIDGLFSDHIDWKLIAKNFDEMLKVAVSIKAGKLLPSTVLRRLGSFNRQNRLYLATPHHQDFHKNSQRPKFPRHAFAHFRHFSIEKSCNSAKRYSYVRLPATKATAIRQTGAKAIRTLASP